MVMEDGGAGKLSAEGSGVVERIDINITAPFSEQLLILSLNPDGEVRVSAKRLNRHKCTGIE